MLRLTIEAALLAAIAWALPLALLLALAALR
jgi:hypothetical protein